MIQARSIIPVAPPVTTRNLSVASRMMVRSARNAAGVVQQGGVDDPADRHVELGDREILHGRESARSGDVEHRERGQVDQRGVLAHG